MTILDNETDDLGVHQQVPPSSRRRQDWVVVAAACCLVIVGVAALLGESLTRYGALSMETAGRLLPPSSTHILGTDSFGRDVLDRIIVGARDSLIIGLAVGLITTIAGGFLGVAVAVWRKVDDLVMRTLDGVMAFPAVFLAIALIAVFGAGIWQVILALSLVYFPRTVRVTRGVALSVVNRPFVEVTRMMGARGSRIVRDHIVPMIYGAVLVQGTYVVARAIVVGASLSFLGLGVPPPDPTWGNMLGEARSHIRDAWWMATFPGLAIAITTVSINLLGDHLRDRFDHG